ncbi:hypothetical protein Dsin_030262 [Dipteronia sinensis]|uniref:RNase H type-1 domain-containing protein n=1 Tax=Dipteronia sinensis TaxID=43782 RepID=A0AAD9ZIH2_9ROSI|nr:hypothetical protein Dsin_030262 [Dipteronia sinensis]
MRNSRVLRSSKTWRRLPCGYKVGRDIEACEGSLGTNNLDWWWTMLWSLKLPTKVKIFIRKACLNWISTAVNLAKRGMMVKPCCQICRKCQSILSMPFGAAPNLMRNQLINQAGVRCDENIVAWAVNFVAKLRSTSGEDTVKAIEPHLGTNQPSTWCCPDEGPYKVNMDAAIRIDENRVGIGIVIRDQFRCVLGSSTQSLVACFSPQVAEATALLRSIMFAVDSGLIPAVVESYANDVVDLVNSGLPPLTHIGTVISDIIRLICCHEIVVSFVPRSMNLVAYSLAKLLFFSEDCFFLKTYPPFVEKVVLADLPA